MEEKNTFSAMREMSRAAGWDGRTGKLAGARDGTTDAAEGRVQGRVGPALRPMAFFCFCCAQGVVTSRARKWQLHRQKLEPSSEVRYRYRLQNMSTDVTMLYSHLSKKV